MNGFRDIVRAMLESRGWVVHRWPTTRFDGMRQSLELLRARGYLPQVVIDCGANTGQWFQLAESIFPDAVYHVNEPQPKCLEALESLRASRRHMIVHPTVVTEPGVGTVRMFGSGDGTGTGNFVAQPEEDFGGDIQVPA